MVKTGSNTMKPKSRSRYYKKYQQLKVSPVLYPSPFQSSLIYFNRLIVFTDAATPVGAFEGAYRVQREAALVNLRPYWSQYRVEKVTMTIQVAEAPNIQSIYMAGTHSPDGATTAASTPTIVSIRSYRDFQMFQTNQNCPKKTWYFNSQDITECDYRDIPAAGIIADDEFKVGGVQFFCAQTVGAGVVSLSVSVKYKVRLMGKQAIAI